MVDPKTVIKLIPEDTLKQAYDDAASEPLKQVGKAGTDIAKTARLILTLPFQFLASYQDRLDRHFEKIKNAVPEDRQQQAPASLAGPIIEKLKYLEDDNYLTDLYLNLLTRAIDKERVNEAHPAFFHIIEQLSPDEAYLLFNMADSLHIEGKRVYRKYSLAGGVLKNDIELNFPEHISMYVNHLVSLSLADFKHSYELATITGSSKNGDLKLSDFGKLFVQACIPENGFNFNKES